MNRLRVGFVGAGSIVRARHIPGLRGCENVELVAVCNSTPESTARAAAEFGIPETCDSWQKLVRRPDLDIVWIGTTPHLHKAVSIASLEAGKHVFCQARMAMNLREAREMLACARAHPRQVAMLCPPPHGMKHGKIFSKLLSEGVIGEPYHLNLQANELVWKDSNAPLHWRQDVEKSGLNALSLGIFAEVLGNWIGYPETVQAQTKISRNTQGGKPVGIPDVVHVIAGWKSGWQGVLQWSGVASGALAPRLECYGSRGTLVYDFGSDEILQAKGSGGLKAVSVSRKDQGEWDVEARFIDAVRHQGSPEPTFFTGVRYMEFIEAVYLSAEKGIKIAVSGNEPEH